MKLNLGCGTDIRNGWTNIDLPVGGAPYTITDSPKGSIIGWDLSRGFGRLILPDVAGCWLIKPGEVELIYSSHFIEHLNDHDAKKLLVECFSILQPGGSIRLCLPDFKAWARAYINNDLEYFDGLGDIHANAKTTIDFMTYVTYQFGEHKSLWDNVKTHRVLTDIGFRTSGIGRFSSEYDIDDPLRKRYSFYMAGVKI